MRTINVGLVADPAFPSEVAHGLGDLDPPAENQRDTWAVERVSEPFTTGSEDVETAMGRLRDFGHDRGWDVVVGLTELPLHDSDGKYLLAKTDGAQQVALLSLPAFGGLRVRRRSRRMVRSLVAGLADPTADTERRVHLSGGGGRWRMLLGMVLANRPWLLVPGLKSALVAALATGAVATINSTVWLLAASLAPWRLAVATVVSLALMVGWIVIDGRLWDRPDDESAEARERSRLYNASTVITLTVGVIICYAVLFLVNLVWAWFVLDPSVMGGYIRTSIDHSDLLLLAWFVASAATVGGALGSGLESDDAIRAAAYSKREEERRRRLDQDQS